MLSFDSPTHSLRLEGEWKVRPTPLQSSILPNTSVFEEKLLVPECANLQPVLFPDRPFWGDHLRGLNDQAWVYRKTFTTAAVPFKRARLRFEGVDYFAEVWLNGTCLGTHEGSFAPFTLDATDAFRPGELNTLLVKVSSPWDKPNPRGSYPINHVIRSLVKGQYEHGEGVIPPNVNPIGIWRPVFLLLDDGVSVDRARVETALDGRLRVTLAVTNATGAVWRGTLALNVTAENHDGPSASSSSPLDLEAGTHEIKQALVLSEPRLWWPWDQGDPNLYRLEATLRDEAGQVTGRLTTTFGVRTVHLERTRDYFTFWINDRPVFVRGSSYMPGLYLGHVDRELLARDVALAREANLNLLRVHVHVSPPELYDICDRDGILIWQDFELNWTHDASAAFEERAIRLQRDMIAMLFNHPSVITWTCHNEPTMVFAHRENYEQRPDPALYDDARQQDPTRPVFICSGQMEHDWERAGDIHTYYGAIWSRRYTDVYRHQMRLNTEFGFEAPAALPTLRRYPDAWKRLEHLESQIEMLWSYQAELVQYHVEHLRRTRDGGTAGYVHFWLVDLVPQVGCGVLDADRQPKGGYSALQRASQPLQVSLEHDGRRPVALWVLNDTPHEYPGLNVTWRVSDAQGRVVESGQAPCDVGRNASQRILTIRWRASPASCERVDLALVDGAGAVIAQNWYSHPFRPSQRPDGYPWKFDPYLGFKVFDQPGAVSLVDQNASSLLRLVPLGVRESLAEWGMRQKLPVWMLSLVARAAHPFVQDGR